MSEPARAENMPAPLRISRGGRMKKWVVEADGFSWVDPAEEAFE